MRPNVIEIQFYFIFNELMSMHNTKNNLNRQVLITFDISACIVDIYR